MNILIVDDNKNNRMILKLLLEDYMEDNEGVVFIMTEAEDGQVAVDKCKTGNFDIVLMDIMMPNMDGIEATKIIRAEYPKMMIIAVSAVDDNERKKLILNSGAEDYISKPVNTDIFISRMENYIALVGSRIHKKNTVGYVNLFTPEIFSRYTNFILDSEDALAEFWEFFLLNARKKSDSLNDVVRSIFTIVEKQFHLSQMNNMLYIEASDEKQYFTLINLDTFPKKMIELILMKNGVTNDYKIEDGKLSFVLDKVMQKEEIVDKSIPEISSVAQTNAVVEEVIASKINITASASLEVFDYIDSDDLFDLEEYAAKLSSIMLLVGGDEVTEEEVQEIYTYLDKLGSVLSSYSEIYVISEALTTLSKDMSSHVEEFITNAEALGPMCKAFSNDMTNWIEQSFHSGAPSIHFMNDTIRVNCQTISGMLKMDEASVGSQDDFDDIFDF
ncbi:MAG: CheY-like chemotaxis protein [Sulfurimonas sp.]|jgi:CheY-like chemotaxis protein|uniref:response regulator n=1 Tax=Sulfurimonas sp. TaxID=2022749 RepID=UPI0039E2CABE